MEEKHEYQDEKVTLSSAYAWIPTVFAVSDDGQDISIDSYINGLGKREQYPTLFRLLELAFKIVMPMLESSATFEFDHHSADTGPCTSSFFGGRIRGHVRSLTSQTGDTVNGKTTTAPMKRIRRAIYSY
jgi:hypothetical protein